MRVARAVAYAALAVVLLLATARLYDGPVALVVVAGRSMEPSLRLGDVALAVKGGYRPGDVVVWCTGPFSCVVHRLIAVEDSIAITKGDANPAPDPPVPLRLVRYKVVAVIPREAVWGPLAAYLGYEAYRWFRRLRWAELSLELVALVVVGSYTAAALATPILLPHPGPESLNIAELLPRVDLVTLKPLPNGTIILAYRFKNVDDMVPVNCTVSAAGYTATCTVHRLSATRFAVSVPVAVYAHAYRAGAVTLTVNAVFELKPMGVLQAYYPVTVAWKQPVIRQEGCTVTITNPNPAPLAINVTVVQDHSSRRETARVPPQGSVELRVEGTAVVVIDYRLPGGGHARWARRLAGC